MTVPVQTDLFNSSTANGLTKTFPYGFKIAAAEDLTVEVDGVKQTSGYSVTGVGNTSGGNVVFTVEPANGKKVLRYLNPVLKRDTDYQQFGDWIASIVNLDFDRIWLAVQKLMHANKRSLKLPVDTATDQVITQDAAGRANKSIKFDASGNLTLTSYDPDTVQAEAAASANTATTQAGIATASASTATTQAGIATTKAAEAVEAAATITPVDDQIHAATAHAIVDTDEMGFWDSVTLGLSKITWANIKATLNTYFDTLYLAIVSPGTSGNVLTSNGSAWISSAPAGNVKLAGDSVQVIYANTGAVATGTTSIPGDDTIPQNTEGDQYLSVSITPTSASNKLLIEVSVNLSTSMTGGNMIAALFQDSAADSLSACMEYLATSDRPLVYSFNHYMTAGSTSAMTFKVRAGHEFGGTTTLNGIGGARKLGGVMSSSITVTEIKV